MILAYPWRDANARRRLRAWILVLPAIWIVTGYWGALVALHLERAPVRQYPQWVLWPALVAPLLCILLAAVFVRRTKGTRLFAAAYAIVNLFFTLSVSFVSGMAITGDWL